MVSPEHATEGSASDDLPSQDDATGLEPSTVGWWICGGVAVALAVVWLALRPASPQGPAAVVDLLVLPAVLFAEARLLAGPPTISAAVLAILFGLGAVFSSLAVLLLEWPAAQVLGPSAMDAFGAVVEVVAPCAPVVVVAALLLRLDRRPTAVDLALGGLASGLGFLVVTSSLLTATSHRAPEYATPLVAGWQQVQPSPGVASISFVGAGVGTALVGLGLGVAIRWPTRPWRIAPPLLAVCIVVLDRVVYDRFGREALAAEVAQPSQLVDFVRRLTFSGRIELAALALGLVLLGRGLHPPIAVDRVLRRRRTPRSAGPEAELGAPPRGALDDHVGEAGSSGRPWGVAAVAAVAVVAATLFVVLARTRHLGFLQDRPVAMAVSIGAFGYALLRLADLRGLGPAPLLDGEGLDAGGPDEGEDPALNAPETVTIPPDDGREVLCLAAMAASGLGIVLSLLPSPSAAVVVPVHRTLVIDAVEGWAAEVGHLGLLLGIGGLAAPPGPIRPRSPGGWRDLLPWRIPSSSWWRGLAPRRRRLGWGGLFWLRPPGDADAPAHRRGRLPWRWDGWRPMDSLPVLDPVDESLVTTTITVEHVDESARARIEFEAPSVQEAMEAALHHLAGAPGRTSLQLLDEGLPPKPGRPGSGRPARVRVLHGRGDDDPLLPPARDSVIRRSPLNVVVEIVDEAGLARSSSSEGLDVLIAPDAGPPGCIEVVITGPSHSETRTLTCSREKASAGRARYRSNPYNVDTGEDAAWVTPPATAAKGVRIRDGEQLRVEYGDQTTAVTVYDGWAGQVIGVNRALFDVAGTHHVNAIAALEQASPTERDHAEIARLRSALVSVENGRRLLVSLADDDEKAFLSTALLHQAMTLDAPGAAWVTEAARAALQEHRRAASTDPAQGESPRLFRRLLASTVVDRLWTAGARSPAEISDLLGWSELPRPDEER